MRDELKVVLVLFAFVVMGIGAIAVLSALTNWMQHTVVNPTVRQNIVDDPNTSIANVANFKQEITAIITDDQNILTTMKKLDRVNKNDPSYTLLQSDLSSYESLRVTHIGSYNADASNADKKHDLPAGMPAHLAISVVTDNTAQDEKIIRDELTMLQTINA